MLNSLLAIGLLGSGLLASIIWPVHLPAEWLSTLSYWYGIAWGLDGIIDMTAIAQDIWRLVFILTMFYVAKFVFGLIALATGSGKPDV